MIPRLLNLPKDESFFLFGARSTGKTTLLRNLSWLKDAFFINLLEAKTENRFARNPDELSAIVRALSDTERHIVIDEIQKLPKLLDIVHDLIETTNKKFILTGSSARRLKREGANLLAGRAFVYHLYPFSFLEIETKFHLNQALQYGLLPKIFEYKTEQKKQLFLEAYANTFLKEEIWQEKFIRELEPFRYFLEVAAQSNGKAINFSNIAKDIGSNDNTVKSYYSILEDTLIGSFLQPFQHSFRKRLSKSPKFYFFDPGVVRVLTGHIELPLVERTSAYGEVFEHFIITQCKQLARYFHRNFRFSYLATKDGAEIDCVVERPGQPILFIEIKSTELVEERHLLTLKTLASDFGECEAVCFSRDPYPKQYGAIKVYPWGDGIKRYFGATGT
ncbi:MAG: AAA family ATPase [Gammaproteobacteria bacterium]|nr:AAA family ATPase [Gammaproteobacteria bacterium]MCH9716401.1 AAA family ATPase [Gammaproteobacteria bacterium]MCH9762980.1 AAA family ATPase [Gammaproteobacteria bacterium]